jgi:integrase
MAKRDVKGLRRVVSKGREYWYLGREPGAPRVRGPYGTPEFWASYDAIVRERRIPEPGRFRALVALYRGSPDYQNLEPATKCRWGPWLDRIADYFDLSIAAFDHPKMRQVIRQWRSQYASAPRTADMGVQVLSRVCAYAVADGKLAGNPCTGIKALYASNRAEIIWTAADVARIKPFCTAEIAHGIDLAATTGLRRGDLLGLSWSHIHDDCIVITTGKSKHRREAVIPLYDALRQVLSRIPKRSPIVLTNSKGQPWSNGGFGSMFNIAKTAAGIGTELHFHDLRGTAATRFYVAGLELRFIAEIMGWEEDYVAKIIRKYVDRAAYTKAIIRQLNKADDDQKVN